MGLIKIQSSTFTTENHKSTKEKSRKRERKDENGKIKDCQKNQLWSMEGKIIIKDERRAKELAKKRGKAEKLLL